MKTGNLFFTFLALVFLFVISCDSSLNPAGYIGGACNNNYCIEGVCVDGKCVPGSLDGDLPDLEKMDVDFDKTEFMDYWVDVDKPTPTDGDEQDKDKLVPIDGDSADIDKEEADISPLVWIDPTTGFMWEKTSEFSKKSWIKALSYCDDLELAGHTDWRLPNISELRTIVRGCSSIETAGKCRVKDKCEVCGVEPINVCLAAMCWKLDDCDSTSCKDNGGANGCYWPEELDGSCYDYWSSSLRDDNSGDVWYTHFLKGSVLSKSKDIANYVRCVRTHGQPVDGDEDENDIDLDDDTDKTDKSDQTDQDKEIDQIEVPEPEFDKDPEPEPDLDDNGNCVSHNSFHCFNNDVYWYDTCGNREDRKQDCKNCSCASSSCVANDQYSYSCNSGDVYYYDCFGNKKSKKEDCGSCSCSGNACTIVEQHTSKCYNNDVYWYNCENVKGAKKEECVNCGCSGTECGTNNQYSSKCDDGDAYWYDCKGVKKAKKQECGDCSCSGDSCVVTSTYTSKCYGGDVYYYDCLGARKSKKEDCGDCGCSASECGYDDQHSYKCDGGNVYWYDCKGEKKAKKEDCGNCGCSANSCDYVQAHSYKCDSGHVYWYDCNGVRGAKKEECGCGCTGTECTNSDEHSFKCDLDDVYWYDCAGVRKAKKEDCSQCTCTGTTCDIVDDYRFSCNSGDLYWYDCKNQRTSKKEECGNCPCDSYGGNGYECRYVKNFTKKCYNGDSWWYDCKGVRQTKADECGANICKDGYCSMTCVGEACQDKETGLYWENYFSTKSYYKSEAITYCNNLTRGGYTDWRMPNISELRSLVRECPQLETGGACKVREVCAPCGVNSSCTDWGDCYSSANCKPSGYPDRYPNCYMLHGVSHGCREYRSEYGYTLDFGDAFISTSGFDYQYVICVRP